MEVINLLQGPGIYSKGEREAGARLTQLGAVEAPSEPLRMGSAPGTRWDCTLALCHHCSWRRKAWRRARMHPGIPSSLGTPGQRSQKTMGAVPLQIPTSPSTRCFRGMPWPISIPSLNA